MKKLDALEFRCPEDNEFPQILHLRFKVLDQPVGLPEKTQRGANDNNPDTIHMAAFEGGAVVSTVRLDPLEEDAYLVRRMATDPAYQGRGIGARVLTIAEKEAATRGAKRIILHSRQGAIGFYSKLGYVLTGHVEIHDGDENPEMTKDLSI